ncbi:profilin [Mycena sanguinolenta]|nr:profilin [Mycena sanguinolenta]
MSWQAYVDTNLVGSGKVTKAAILGKQGGVWAASPGYELSPEEQAAIVGAFGKLGDIQAHGVRLAGVKFFATRAEEKAIHGKKGGDGCIIVPTVQAILVAEYTAPLQAPEVVPVVEGLADYLISVKY